MSSQEDLSKRRTQLRNLVVMALADGSLGEREVNLVADRCAELGLDEYDLQKAVEFGLGDDAALELPLDQADRQDLMTDLIRMMAADGKLEEGEKRLFALAAAKMSISTEEVESLIDKTLEQ
ncbi:MAG: TerB family tellurite resistance protein [Rubripirellula sp.]